MKTNELRLGNYILGCKVTEICPDGVFAERRHTYNLPKLVFIKEDDIEPIELTEEVLLKIGFVKIELVKNEQYKYYKKICIDNYSYSYILDFIVVPKDEYISFHIIEYGKEGEYDEVDYYSEVFSSDNIKNLHQLQNAYYLLTNEELEVEL